MPLDSPVALWVVIALAAGFGVVLLVARFAWKRQVEEVSSELAQVRSAQEKLAGELEQARRMQDQTAKAIVRDQQALLSRERELGALKAENERLAAELETAQVDAVLAEEQRQETEAKLEQERQTLQAQAETQRRALESRLDQLVRASGSGQKELEERARKLSAAQHDAKTKGEQIKALQTELADLRKQLGDAQAGAKKQVEVQAEAARAKQAATQAEARAEASRAEAAAAKQEAAALGAKLKGLEAELAAAKTAPAQAAVPAGVIAALEADPKLNRGQRETIRMMYDQFTRAGSKR